MYLMYLITNIIRLVIYGTYILQLSFIIYKLYKKYNKKYYSICSGTTFDII